MPHRGPNSTGILEHPGSTFHHIFKPKGFSKGHLQRSLSNLPPAKQGQLRHSFGNVSAVIQNAFFEGVKTYGVPGYSVGGGGKRMVENCFPCYCGHNWEGGGVKRMVQRKGGGGNVPKFWTPEIKKRSHPEPSTIFNHCLHRTLFCPWVAVVTS